MTRPSEPPPSRSMWMRIAAVVLLQAGFLVWLVADRVSLLTAGREITLKVIPVDPRDLFRGDYVILGYELSPVSAAVTPAGMTPNDLYHGAPVYVTITPDATKGWTAAAIATSYPRDVKDGDAVLKGFVTGLSHDSKGNPEKVHVRYGIESYFVPEGEGRAIEAKVREAKVEALIAVGPTGTAALKALLVDGQKIHEQPVL